MVLPLEPGSSPQSVQASSKNSTSVSVSWAAVGKDHRNGIIKGYKVIYQALPDGKNAIRFINISNKHQEKEQDIINFGRSRQVYQLQRQGVSIHCCRRRTTE